ncbi:TBC1 domain family member 30 [Armadillidium vulgare]|nr:TBC1 domain family member 30 [Armadillidium vulgare]
MWLTLAEQHVRRRGIIWKEAERTCFNEWASPDDEGLGDQIIKDLHRTGCSLFCGADAEGNQALLKRVLLGYARWNKNVGYCQGFNMLAAIILEVMDRQESDALKVMIYLIEGVLPESYFANNLRGLSVDMAVFRELMRVHLPELSRHLEQLQHEAADQATGACYEPPLTNVFTMQWFLTLFSNCLPRDAVMRVWDLTFLQGNEMLLRTALAIWGRLSSRILEVPTADEFYCVMGDLTRKMLTHGLMDTNQLVQTLIAMAPFPFPGLAMLRDKYTYNITPWAQSVSSVARKGFKIFLDEDEEDEKTDHEDVNQKVAIATVFGLGGIFRKSSDPKPLQGENIPVVPPHQPTDVPNMAAQPLSGMARPNLDISALKKQYSRLRERQKQAHIILTASNIRRRSIDEVNRLPSLQKTNQLTMKHLLRGKKALTTKTKRVVAQGVIPPIITKTKVTRKLSDSTGMKKQNGGLDRATKGSLKPNLSKALEPPVVQSTLTNEVVKPKEEETLSPSGPEAAEEVQDDLEDEGESPLPSETLHWKDTPRRARRASLPHGVKLMESLSAPLPDIKDDDIGEEEFEDDNSSTSTELCDEDLAVLSEEEPPAVIPRALSTSPRLENHDLSRKENDDDKCLPNSTVIPELITVDLSESSEVKESEGERSEGASLSQQENNDINLISDNSLHEELGIPLTSNSIESTPDIIPTFITPPSLQKASLSSPTKWKWSFSEIENPDLIEPVSPILKLHNFLSEESVEEEEDNSSSLTFLPPSPKIVINNESTLPEESTIQYDPSSIFAYLFEITDVSKLSNVNSEEPSPVEDMKEILSKSDTENLFDDKEWINSNIVRDRFSSFITLEETAAAGLVENEENTSPDFFPTQKNKWKTDSEDAKDDDLKYEDEKEEAGEKSTILKNEFSNIRTDAETEEKAAKEIHIIEKGSSVDISSDLLQNNCKINEQNSGLDDLEKRDYVASDVFISEIKRKVSNDTECQLEGPVEDISPKTENEIKAEINKPSVTDFKNEIISDSKSVKENLKLILVKSIEDNSSVLANETESRKSEEIAAVTRNDSDAKALTITSENTNLYKNLTLNLDLESISDNELHTLRAQNEISKEHEKDYLTHENNAHDLKEIQPSSHKDDLESKFSLNVSSHEKDKKEKEILSKNSFTTDVKSSDITLNQSDQEIKNNDTERDTTLLKDILKPDNISQKDSDFISRFSSTDYKSCIESPSKSLPFTFNSDISKAKSLIENEKTTKDESLSSTKFNAVISNKTEPVSINVSQNKVSTNQTNDKESSNEKVNPENDFKSILHYKRSTVPSVKFLTEEKNKDTASSEHLSNIETGHTKTENDKVGDNNINSVVLNSNKSKVSEKRKIESKDTVTSSSASLEGSLPYEIVELATESQTSSLKDARDDNVKNVDLRKYYFSSVFKSVSLESETNEMKDEETDEDSSDMSDPAKDLTDEATEVIRRKLWAGVKSLSLDADLLIATNKAQKCYLDFSSSLPTLDESPSNETNSDSGKDMKSEKEVSTLVTHRKGPTRRKSEAALKLMKENTKIIDQILNQRYGEENDNIFLIKKEELEDFKDRKPSLCFSKSESLSDHNISESFNETESETTNNKNFKTFQRSASHESLENLKIICLDRNNSSISSFFLLDDDKSKDTEKKSSNSKINITECITQKTTNVSTYFNPEKEEKELKSLDLENELNTKENNLKNEIETTPKHTTKVSPPIVPFCKLSKLSPKTKSSSRTLLNGSSKSFDISSTIKKETISKTSTSSCQTSPEEPAKAAAAAAAQVKLKLRESLSDVIPDHIQVKQQPRTPCSFKTGLQEFQGSVQDVRLPEGIQPIECDQIIPQAENMKTTPPTESIQNKNATKQHFNPFPTTKPLHRSPKDAALKVGLYNSNKSLSDSS